jgi:hypothetical protein
MMMIRMKMRAKVIVEDRSLLRVLVVKVFSAVDVIRNRIA